jgi:hypothetical protein
MPTSSQVAVAEALASSSAVVVVAAASWFAFAIHRSRLARCSL